MKARVNIKGCPFCGNEITAFKGVGNVTVFKCLNDNCGAVVSFNGSKSIGNGAAEAVNPLENWSRRANENVCS